MELVVALGVLAAALLPFLSSLVVASRGVSLGWQRVQAVDLLVLAAEETRAGLEDGTIAVPGQQESQSVPQYEGTPFTLLRTLEPVGRGGGLMVRVRLELQLEGRTVADTVFLWHPWRRGT